MSKYRQMWQQCWFIDLLSSLNGIKISQNNPSPSLLYWQILLSNITYLLMSGTYYPKGKLFFKRPLSLAHMSK